MKKFLLFLLAWITLLSACTPTPEGDLGAARTAAAQTLDAQLSLAQAEQSQLTAQVEQTAAAQTHSAQQTQSALETQAVAETQFAQATFAATETRLIAPSGASCRFGPGTGFPVMAEIEAGSAVTLLARDIDGQWWQVEWGDGSTCWVDWSNDLTFEGDVFNLPLIEGPALPTATIAPTREPGFNLGYVADHVCDGVPTGIFEIRNTGSQTYESVRMRLFDVAAEKQLRAVDGNNEFLSSSSACPKGNSALAPGQSAFLAIPLSGTSTGDVLRLSVQLCTENGLGGSCISGNRQFTR